MLSSSVLLILTLFIPTSPPSFLVFSFFFLCFLLFLLRLPFFFFFHFIFSFKFLYLFFTLLLFFARYLLPVHLSSLRCFSSTSHHDVYMFRASGSALWDGPAVQLPLWRHPKESHGQLRTAHCHASRLSQWRSHGRGNGFQRPWTTSRETCEGEGAAVLSLSRGEGWRQIWWADHALWTGRHGHKIHRSNVSTVFTSFFFSTTFFFLFWNLHPILQYIFHIHLQYLIHSSHCLRWIHERQYNPALPEGTSHAKGIESMNIMLNAEKKLS